MDWDLIVACNNDDVLRTSLLSSPDCKLAKKVIIQRGFHSAASAYNDGIRRAGSEIVVLAHQDVFFPEGFGQRLESALRQLEQSDPKWGVAGVFGVDAQGLGRGCVYSTGLRRMIGKMLEVPAPVRSLDELVLILRRDAGLRFDDQLPGFHLYGTDICLEAARLGYSCYALPCFCIHNSRGMRILPQDYWFPYLYMRRKWWSELPVETPCVPVTRACGSAFRYLVRTSLRLMLGRIKTGRRVSDPEELYWQLTNSDNGKEEQHLDKRTT